MRKKVTLITAAIFLATYFYSFYLCIWGKPLYGEIGNIQYIIAFHMLAIVNYFLLGIVADSFTIGIAQNRSELFFLLHGSLISVFPYNNYLVAGFVLIAASLITSGLKSKRE
ncbi:MAG: hypothetical protein ACHQFX_13835 [Chitinophagales bacterium]